MENNRLRRVGVTRTNLGLRERSGPVARYSQSQTFSLSTVTIITFTGNNTWNLSHMLEFFSAIPILQCLFELKHVAACSSQRANF